MAPDGRVDGALVLRQGAADEREVDPGDVAALHGRDQPPVGLVAPGDDQQAGRVLVEAVDDAGARDPADRVAVHRDEVFGDQPLGDGPRDAGALGEDDVETLAGDVGADRERPALVSLGVHATPA